MVFSCRFFAAENQLFARAAVDDGCRDAGAGGVDIRAQFFQRAAGEVDRHRRCSGFCNKTAPEMSPISIVSVPAATDGSTVDCSLFACAS